MDQPAFEIVADRHNPGCRSERIAVDLILNRRMPNCVRVSVMKGDPWHGLIQTRQPKQEMRFLGVGLDEIGLQPLRQPAHVPEDACVEAELFWYAMYLNTRLPRRFDEGFDTVDRAGNALLRPLERGNRQIDERAVLKPPGYAAELEEILRNARYNGCSLHHRQDANPGSGIGIRIRHHAVVCWAINGFIGHTLISPLPWLRYWRIPERIRAAPESFLEQIREKSEPIPATKSRD